MLKNIPFSSELIYTQNISFFFFLLLRFYWIIVLIKIVGYPARILDILIYDDCIAIICVVYAMAMDRTGPDSMFNSFRLIKYYTLYIANLANKVATVVKFQQYDQ